MAPSKPSSPLYKSLATALDKKDEAKQYELVGQIILLSAANIDMMHFYPLLVQIFEVASPILKRAISLYIARFSKQTPRESLMILNSLQKDMLNASPFVRANALKTIFELIVEEAIEILPAVLVRSLETDHSDYVKRVAVMRLPKLNNISPNSLSQHKILPKIEELMSSTEDPALFRNCVQVLSKIGKLVLTKQLVLSIMSTMPKLNEWGQLAMLPILRTYRPSAEDLGPLFNLMDGFLVSTNAAIVAETIQVFLAWGGKELEAQVTERVRIPVVNMILTSDPDLQFALLTELKEFNFFQAVFGSAFTALFCISSDPPFLKRCKLSLMSQIATKDNITQIFAHLSNKVFDREIEGEAISALCAVVLKLPTQFDTFISLLQTHLKRRPSLATAIITELPALMRRFPRLSNMEFISSLPSCLPFLSPEAHVQFLWILGSAEKKIPQAPYIFESYVEQFLDLSSECQLQLQSSLVSVYLQRPAECLPQIKALFQLSLFGAVHVTVREQAMLYFQMLHQNPEKVQSLIFQE